MNGVEAFCFALAHPDALGCDNAQAVFFKNLGDGASEITLVASGLIIENVRSIAIIAVPCHRKKVGGVYPPKRPKNKGAFRNWQKLRDISRRCHTAPLRAMQIEAALEPVSNRILGSKRSTPLATLDH